MQELSRDTAGGDVGGTATAPAAAALPVPAPRLAAAAASGGAAAAGSLAGPLLVAMAGGLAQLDGCLVVINSAAMHAAVPQRLKFRVVTTADEKDALVRGLRERLPPELDIDAVAFDPWLPRVMLLLGGKSSGRAELFSALNFAAFYLHEVFPSSQRVLYLDTDVVVLTDLAAELAGVDLHSQPAGAAEDCSQRLGKYVDLERLRRKGVAAQLGLELHGKKKTCVLNRGVVLVDTAAWAALNITGAIEALVQAHLSKHAGPLWRSGVSQPPFLLALAGRYHDLGAEFNVRGLGRGDIAPEEIAHYKDRGLWKPYFDKFLRKCKFHCCGGCKGWAMSPYLSPVAHLAKILHYNGKLKPDKAGNRSLAPLPPPPKDIDDAARAPREQVPLCSCGETCVQECAAIWWEHLPRVV